MRWMTALLAAMTCALLLGFGPFNRSDDAAREQLSEAQAQLKAGDTDAAIATLRQLRLKYQDSDAGYEGTALLGVLLFERGDVDGALTAAQGVLQGESAPGKAVTTAHLVAGLALHERGQDVDARGHLAPLEGKVTTPADLALLATAMAEISAASGNAASEVSWQVQRLTVTPEEAQAPLRARIQRLILTELSPAELTPLAERYSPYFPADYAVLALARAALREGDYPTAVRLAERFATSWPEHPEAEAVALIRERASRQDAMDPTRIGVILPLTGRFSAPGEAVKRGMELALQRLEHPAWTGKRIQLVFKDSAGEEAQAAAAVKDLFLNDRVAAIIGPLTSGEAMAPAELAQDLEIPLVTLTQRAGVPEVGSYIFRNFPTTERQMSQLGRFLAEEMGIKKLGILYPENRYGTWTAGLVWDDAVARGIEITAAEAYESGADDYTPVALKIAGKFYVEPRNDELRNLRWRAKNDDDPKNDDVELPAIVDFDALFVADHYRATALLAQALAYVEIPIGRFTVDKRDPIPLIGGNTWNNPELARIGGDYVVGATFVSDFFAGADNPATREFVSAWRKTYGGTPETFAAHGYDSVAVLLHVLAQGQPQSREEIRDRLDAVEAFEGASGTFSFADGGELDREPFILRINRRREIVQVYPPVEPPAKKK